MAFSSLGRLRQRADQIIAIDLGSRTTKAVCLERTGDSISIVDYTFQEAPFSDRKLSTEALSEHLRAVVDALKSRTKHVVLLVGAKEALICQGEMPFAKPPELRRMVQLNSKNYFQEELDEHYFECQPVRENNSDTTVMTRTPGKIRVVIGAVRRQFLDELEIAAKSAGLLVDEVIPNQLGPVNAVVALPDTPRDRVIAVVDIGFDSSTICLLYREQLMLTRVVNIGADRLTTGLAEALNITYPVAEGLKQIMPEKVQAKLQAQIAPLARELRASIDFFEHQQERTVTEVFLSGGSARSAFIVQMVQSELSLPCHGWDPTKPLTENLDPNRMAEIRQDAPQLTAAIGAGLGWFRETAVHLNLLAEKQEEIEIRRRDPAKRATLVALILVALMVTWVGYLRFKIGQADRSMDLGWARLRTMQETSAGAASDAARSTANTRTLSELEYVSTNRFVWHAPLLSLGQSMVDRIQVVRIRGESIFGPAPMTNYDISMQTNNVPTNRFASTLSVQAKDYGVPPASEKFMETIGAEKWFESNVHPGEGIRLKDRLAPLVDPADPTKTFILFSIECFFERTF